MVDEGNLKKLVEELLLDTEFFLVDVRVQEEDRLFVELDRMDGISIEDCVELNRQIRERLEEKGMEFELNVSSPGLDEPFKVAPQFRKNLGKEVSVLTRNGQKFKGVLDDVDASGIRLKTQKKERVEGKKKKELVEKEHRFAFDELKETKAIIGIK